MTKKEAAEEEKRKSTFLGNTAMGGTGGGVLKNAGAKTLTETGNGFPKFNAGQEGAFKQSYGNFYGVTSQEASKLDYNKLYQASRVEMPQAQPAAPTTQPMNPELKRNAKLFYDGQVSESSTVYRANAGKFFDNGGNELGDKFKHVNESRKPEANGNKTDVSKLNRKDVANFLGTDYHETESQGSQFQRNAAHFMDCPTPARGDRPFKIEKTIPSQETT